MNNRLRQLQPLLHPRRIRVNLPIALLAHADEIEHLMRSLPGGLERQPAQLRAVSHVFAAHHPRDVAILLWRVAHSLANVPALMSNLAPQQPR